MADNDDKNIYDETTPLDELMDAPTPMDDVDEVIYIDDEDESEGTEEDDLFLLVDGLSLVNGKLIRKGVNGHADIYRFDNLVTRGTLILKLYPLGAEPDDVSLGQLRFLTGSDMELSHLVPVYRRDAEGHTRGRCVYR